MIKCPECGREISDRASTCPHCGVEINGLKRSYSAITVATVVALLGILLGLYFAQNAREQMAQHEQVPVTDSISPAKPAAQRDIVTDVPPLPALDDSPALPEVEEDVLAEDDASDSNNSAETVTDIPELQTELHPLEVDDFEEVNPEEEERHAPMVVEDVAGDTVR